MVAARALAALVVLLFGLVCPRLAAAESCIQIEDFAKGKIGEFPPDWKPRKESGRAVYGIREEDGRRFLHADSRRIGIQAAKQHEVDLAEYPILVWSWRPIEFPKGSDERNPKTNDSALAVYAVFPHTAWSVKSLKYIWSAVVPVGTRLTSSAGLTQVRVLESGTRSTGQWIDERVNVLDDFRASFDTTETPKLAGIAVLTDADDTGSSAQGDYANFRACRP
ncbi:MAG TPA: DUF3047 domain-containing protein [Candidatus Methylomirabilis sp.]|nr:DUF3047 domain-containing protein [Candidatus Methylomirabilis sp.]